MRRQRLIWNVANRIAKVLILLGMSLGCFLAATLIILIASLF